MADWVLFFCCKDNDNTNTLGKKNSQVDFLRFKKIKNMEIFQLKPLKCPNL